MNTFLPAIDLLTVKFALVAVLLPLVAFSINLIVRGKQNRLAGWISTLAVLIGLVCATLVFSRVWNAHAVHLQIRWFTIGSTSIDAGILLNNLSALMLLLVNAIALPVHIYSIAYMGHDEDPKRYFTYLSFFCFSMLALVVADNLLLFYVFWELVGFSSYLLIGFWFTRDKAVAANKKAFIMNRIGDIGLLMAIIILFSQYHTFDLDKLFGSGHLVNYSYAQPGRWSAMNNIPNATLPFWLRQQAAVLPPGWQYVAFGGVFLAVAAKSAQFPLHTWLPDAMEGPASISALIHAATMVAAGVFLLGRVYPMFNQTELNILAVVGCFTAFMAATIALAQNDLKRILAYSTISQLGFMVMAMGVGAYGASLFHLATHAFFKCLLFLVAGIVIHQMERLTAENNSGIDPQNIQNMGGQHKQLPVTFVTAVIAAAALAGLPLTSGFLSKDDILVQSFTWAQGKGAVSRLVPFAAILTSWLTAFYITRLIVKVFVAGPRVPNQSEKLATGSDDRNWFYRLPLVLLVVCCLFPLFSANPLSATHSWLLAGFAFHPANDPASFGLLIPLIVSAGSVAVIVYTWLIYSGRLVNPFPQSGPLFRFVCGQWYFNEVYDRVIVKPILLLSRACFWTDRGVIDGFIDLFAKVALLFSKVAAFIDRRIIDGFINLLVMTVRGIGDLVRKMQGGKVQYYLFSMLVFMLALFILKIWVL